MAIEIVDLPSYKMVMFHSFSYGYQRVLLVKKQWFPVDFPLNQSNESLNSHGWTVISHLHPSFCLIPMNYHC